MVAMTARPPRPPLADPDLVLTDPLVRQYVRERQQLPSVEFSQLTIAEARRGYAPAEGSVPVGVVMTDEQLPLDDGERLRIRRYTPTQRDAGRGWLMYLHGGGWTLGDLDHYDALCGHLAERSGMVVVSVGYRRAPEHPFPGPLDDAWQAWRVLYRQAAGELGAGRAPRMVIAGDSAGGNLSAVIARRAADQWERPAAQGLLYPVTDCDLTRDSYDRYGRGFVLTRSAMAWFWQQYCPRVADQCLPDAAPLRAPSLAGCAPAFVAVCACDPLADEGVAYGERCVREIPVCNVWSFPAWCMVLRGTWIAFRSRWR